jgi:UDP-glucose 4-epimerase
LNTSTNKVLVTGASGYIGAHLCKTLADHGYVVDGLDNNWSTHNHPEKYLNTKITMDITGDLNFCWDYDTIIHLAGVISVEESTRRPAFYFDTNTRATKDLILASKPKNFIYASTAGAFDAQSPYALSKLMSEWVIRELCKNYTIFRFFNVAGSSGLYRQVGESTHLIRRAAEVAAGKRDKLYLYGTDYDTRDGTCIRDYIHVQDLVDAIVKAVYNPSNTEYECLGSGIGSTCLEVINTMKKVTGVDFEVVESPRRAGDPPSLKVDNPSKFLNCERTLEDMCLSAYNMELQ